MAKNLVRALKRDPIDKLRSQLEELQRKKQTLDARRTANDEMRQANAFDAVNGDTTARENLNTANASAFQIVQEAGELELAIQTAQRRLDEAEAEAREAELQAGRADLQAKLKVVMQSRLEAARQVEAGMQQTEAGLKALDALGAEAAMLREALIGKVGPDTESGLIVMEKSMRSGMTENRAIEYAARIGLHRRFGFEAIAGSVRTGPASFAEGEAAVQRRFAAALHAEQARGASAPASTAGAGTVGTWL